MTATTADAELSPGRQALRGQLEESRRERLKPPPTLTVSAWADAHRYLSREASAEPGKWRTERAPYLREVMDAISDASVDEVVVMSASQVGKTEILLNAIGYYADQDPAPILVIQPSLEVGQAFSKDRVAPMARDTPRLRRKFADAKSRTADNTILHKTFPGGHLTIVGANSPAGLASRPIRILLADEVDRYPASAGTEGDPVTLGKKRTSTFWNRKLVLTSSPTLKNLSRIEKAYEDSSQGAFHVPCPACRRMGPLTWAAVRWENHDPDTAHLVCTAADEDGVEQGCGALIQERDKAAMLRAGRWVHRIPERRVRGFHLNALYSPWARWRDLVDEFLKAQGKPEMLKAFMNTVLAETWQEDAERADPEGLMARRQDYGCKVPAFVGRLTAGVDIQADRIELLVRGWGTGEESVLVHFETLRGDPTRSDIWADVDRVLKQQFEGMAIAATCIDSGYLPEEVYKFVAPRQRRRIFATKGNSTPGQPAAGRPSKKPNRYGVKIVPIGTETVKDTIYLRLKTKHPGPGYYHFPAWVDAEYFAQLTAEYQMTKYSHGRPYRVYEKDPSRRNEALDLEVLAYVALLLLGPTTIRSLGNLASKRTPPPPTPDAPEPTPAQQVIRRILQPRKAPGFARNW